MLPVLNLSLFVSGHGGPHCAKDKRETACERAKKKKGVAHIKGDT